MICPCGGQVHAVTRFLKTREALLEWFPDATDHPLPATITVRTCGACGRLDEYLVRPVQQPLHCR